MAGTIIPRYLESEEDQGNRVTQKRRRKPATQERQSRDLEKGPMRYLIEPLKWAVLDLNQRPLRCQRSALAN